MKISTAHVGLSTILPYLVLAEQPKQWEKRRVLFEKRTVSNFTVGNGNTGIAQVNSAGNDTNINLNLDPTVINNFNAGVINYYSNAPDCYYAKFCNTCNVVKVSKGNGTYVDKPCPTCPIQTLNCPGYSPLKTVPSGSNGTTGVYKYQTPVCVGCLAVPAPKPPPMTAVTVNCPTCPVTSTVITCPATAASSIASIASVSGASAAKVVASQAAGITVTAPTTVASPAASTVVNVPCSSCPAGTQAVTVAQVTPGPAQTVGPSPPSSPGNASSPAGPGPSSSRFTGSAGSIVSSVLSIVLGLVASTIMFL